MRDNADRRFTRKEVIEATGINRGVITYRVRKLGIKTTKDGYTYEDIKQIMQYKGARICS